LVCCGFRVEVVDGGGQAGDCGAVFGPAGVLLVLAR
jgi:hypothetical protein